MSFQIEQGREEHLPDVIRLVRELAEFERAPEAVINTAERMKEEQDYFDFYVATVDGAVVGAAIYFFAYYTWVGKSLYLDDLYVQPEFRGQKIATALLDRVFQVAKEKDCQRVRWQVLDWNENAIGVYNKLGANIDSEWLNCDFDRNKIEQLADGKEK